MSNLNDELEILYEEMSSIGIRANFSSNSKVKKNELPDIERVIVKMLYKIDSDGRMLGLLFSWLEVHSHHLIADKLFKEYSILKKYNGETPWLSALCNYLCHKKDYRFKKGIKKYRNPHSLFNTDQTTLIKLKGSVEVFEEVGILVPSTALRIRESDVLTPLELVKKNIQYRNRYIYGANWRAEIITSIQKGAENPNQVSKILGIARSRVGIVFKEYMLVKDLI